MSSTHDRPVRPFRLAWGLGCFVALLVTLAPRASLAACTVALCPCGTCVTGSCQDPVASGTSCTVTASGGCSGSGKCDGATGTVSSCVTPATSCASGNVCQTGTCSHGGCAVTNKSNTTVCGQGSANGCQPLFCNSGTCSASPTAASESSVAGDSCNGSDACAVGYTCDGNGNCLGGTTVDCTQVYSSACDHPTCTTAGCGVTHCPNAGSCQANTNSCTFPVSPAECFSGSSTSACESTAGGNAPCNYTLGGNYTTSPCSEFDQCHSAGQCSQGACIATTPVVCPSQPPAPVISPAPYSPSCYQPIAPACSLSGPTCPLTNYVPVPSPSPGGCSDGDPCTYNDICQAPGAGNAVACKGVQGTTSIACAAACPGATLGICDGNGFCTLPDDLIHTACVGHSVNDACDICDACTANRKCVNDGSAKLACVGTAATDGTSCTTPVNKNCLTSGSQCQCLSGKCEVQGFMPDLLQPAADMSLSDLSGDMSGAPSVDLSVAVTDMAQSGTTGTGGTTGTKPKGSGKSSGCAFVPGASSDTSAMWLLLSLLGTAMFVRRRFIGL